MKRHQLISAVAVIAIAAGVCLAKTPESAFNKDPWPQKKGPLKVYILCGQSNMQGHAALRTLEYLIYNEETAAEYQEWKDRYGNWNERSDVWVWTMDGARYGKLRPGFGGSEREMGPELGFGQVMGEKSGQQVLLIKACWGGKSVKRDFLSPGSKLPSDEQLQKELEGAKKKKPDATMADVKDRYGFYYRQTLKSVNEVLGELKELYPKYDGKAGYELAGFVFFQGWNDMVDGSQRAEKYARFTTRLAQMIKDFRKDLKAPNLPVVIGELGAGGKRGDFQAAQEAATKLPEFAGNVKFVKTADFWEPDVDKMVSEGVWHSPDWVKFYNVGSEKGYHYLGSARIYTKIGKAMANAMLEMTAAKKAQ